jgi:hypothetical protein
VRVKETIAQQLPKIRHWRVRHCSYSDAPLVNATWFIDPPYQRAGKYYRFNSTGIDYKALSRWCRSRPGQVIVCENRGADWLPFEKLSDVKTTRANYRSREVVWTRASTRR